MANLFKQVLFNNGEGLEYTDLNAMQQFAAALLNDAVLQEQLNAHLSATYLYAGGPLTAMPISSATLLRSEHTGGMVWQLPSGATVDGDDPALLGYYISTNEFQTDHAAQHATLERYDVVCLQLAVADGVSTSRDFRDSATDALTTTTVNKQKRVTCVKSVVAGTPAAVGTATEPAVTAGHVKWYTVRIRPVSEGDGSLNDDAYRDYVVPMNYGQDMVDAERFHNFTFGTSALFRKVATAASQVCYIVPTLPNKSRLLAVELTNLLTAGSTVQLVRVTPTAGGFSENVIKDCSALVSAAIDTTEISCATDAIWDNSQANRGGGFTFDVTKSFLALKVTCNASGDQLSKARFTYAKG